MAAAVAAGDEPEPEPQQPPPLTAPSNYGQPGDHRYTFPDDRIPSSLPLKTAAECVAGLSPSPLHLSPSQSHAP
jgi:hypothetical protein